MKFPIRCVTNPNSPVKCQNAAVATLGSSIGKFMNYKIS